MLSKTSRNLSSQKHPGISRTCMDLSPTDDRLLVFSPVGEPLPVCRVPVCPAAERKPGLVPAIRQRSINRRHVYTKQATSIRTPSRSERPAFYRLPTASTPSAKQSPDTTTRSTQNIPDNHTVMFISGQIQPMNHIMIGSHVRLQAASAVCWSPVA